MVIGITITDWYESPLNPNTGAVLYYTKDRSGNIDKIAFFGATYSDTIFKLTNVISEEDFLDIYDGRTMLVFPADSIESSIGQ
jgi:hypothetical protein